MSLTLTDVARLAQLARLRIEPEEARSLLAELNSVLDLADRLQAVDTRDIAPMTHASDMLGGADAALRLRPDEVTETDQRSAFQAVAPAVRDGLYLVPRVIE
jgi:aspartyl-tRNA(Asn)/glutamyl-tRNA(Gln) amidotransferase subunit C